MLCLNNCDFFHWSCLILILMCEWADVRWYPPIRFSVGNFYASGMWRTCCDLWLWNQGPAVRGRRPHNWSEVFRCACSAQRIRQECCLHSFVVNDNIWISFQHDFLLLGYVMRCAAPRRKILPSIALCDSDFLTVSICQQSMERPCTQCTPLTLTLDC